MENAPEDSFIGYMCKTDFEYDARGASDGARVYPSEAAVRRERKCTSECGIVEVRLTLTRVVQKDDFGAYRQGSAKAALSPETP